MNCSLGWKNGRTNWGDESGTKNGYLLQKDKCCGGANVGGTTLVFIEWILDGSELTKGKSHCYESLHQDWSRHHFLSQFNEKKDSRIQLQFQIYVQLIQ